MPDARVLLEALAAACRVTGRTVFRRAGHTGHLTGSVEAAPGDEGVLLRVRGRWRGGATPLRVGDAVRWSRPEGDRLRVEHLRRGRDEPVRLAELEPAPGGGRSRDPHVCGEDRYHAWAGRRGPAVLVRWRVEGPGKEGRIRRAYRPGPVGPPETMGSPDQGRSGRRPGSEP